VEDEEGMEESKGRRRDCGKSTRRKGTAGWKRGETEGTDKILMKRVILIDHVMNQVISLREAGKQIQCYCGLLAISCGRITENPDLSRLNFRLTLAISF